MFVGGLQPKESLLPMGRGIAFMVADVGAKFPPYIFATDAQGEGEGDHGGYGVAGSYADSFDWNSVLTCGEMQGHTVRRLGDFRGTK